MSRCRRPSRKAFREHCKNLSPVEIAELCGVKLSTVYVWRHHYKIRDERRHKGKLTAQDVEDMRTRSDLGESSKTIIRDYPISESHGYHILAYTKR